MTLGDQPASTLVEMEEPPLWMQGAVYPAGLDRELLTAVLPPGVIGNALRLVPRGLGANMSVDVEPGPCVVTGTDAPDQGNYLCRSRDTVNLPVGDAPGAGLSRIDIIVARVYDAAVTGGDRDVWALEVVPGVAATAPAAPATPPSSLGLGFVIIPAGLAAITAAQIGDVRLASGPFRVRWTRSQVVGGGTVFGCSPQIDTQFFAVQGTGSGITIRVPCMVHAAVAVRAANVNDYLVVGTPYGATAKRAEQDWGATIGMIRQWSGLLLPDEQLSMWGYATGGGNRTSSGTMTLIPAPTSMTVDNQGPPTSLEFPINLPRGA